MTISIVTVVYNGEKTIAETIESVCYQSRLPEEYIIIDGASTDDTLEVISKYEEKYPFIKVVSEKDNGIYDAMNKGINLCTGHIIGILNADDYYEQGCLENVLNSFKKNGEGIHYGILRYIENNKEIYLCRYHHEHLNRKMIPHPATFVSRNMYVKFGNFNIQYKYSSDLELMIRFRNKGVNFFPIDRILANFRTDGISNSVKAGVETLNIKKLNNLISKKEYILGRLKKAIRFIIEK